MEDASETEEAIKMMKAFNSRERGTHSDNVSSRPSLMLSAALPGTGGDDGLTKQTPHCLQPMEALCEATKPIQATNSMAKINRMWLSHR